MGKKSLRTAIYVLLVSALFAPACGEESVESSDGDEPIYHHDGDLSVDEGDGDDAPPLSADGDVEIVDKEPSIEDGDEEPAMEISTDGDDGDTERERAPSDGDDPPPDGDPFEEEDDPDGDRTEGPPGLPGLLAELDELKLYINIGDSVGAGYNAELRNFPGGRGYSRLLLDNHGNFPEYFGHHLRAYYPDALYYDLAESGDTSDGALEQVQGAMFYLPWSVDGDVLVTLTCGGNDFNDDIQTMMLRWKTEAAAENLKDNYREIVRLLRERYEQPSTGRKVVFLMTNVHDPTGGTGAVPAQFTDGFCELLQNPLLIPVRGVVLGNLDYYNQQIQAITGELGGHLVDNHSVFIDHGMNAQDRWIDSDCIHPLGWGHHQLRREEWFVLTGQRF